jgi:acyl-CoA dehydrogenase
LTLTAVDKQIKPSVASAIAKYHMTEMGRQVINNAMDIHGGKGIMMGPHNYLGRAYQATPVSITVEGANILTRNLIIFGQGSVRCHPFMLTEMEAVSAGNLKAFDQVIFRHVGYVISTGCRAVWNGLTAGKLIDRPNNKLGRYYRDVTRISTALAMTSELTMLTLGGALKRKERISARLGDVMSYLYMASAVLKVAHDHHYAEAELPLMRWSLEHCLYQAQEALIDTYENLPSRWLYQVNFLWGKPFKKPNDRLDRAVVKAMLEEPKNRQWFAQYCHLSTGIMPLLKAALDNPTPENIQKVVAVDAFLPQDL